MDDCELRLVYSLEMILDEPTKFELRQRKSDSRFILCVAKPEGNLDMVNIVEPRQGRNLEDEFRYAVQQYVFDEFEGEFTHCYSMVHSRGNLYVSRN